MRQAKKKPRLGERLIQGLTDIRDAVKSGQPLEQLFTCRTVVLDLEPREFDAEDIRAIRLRVGASQSLFAKILGASTATVESWEQGLREPEPMARRLLEEIDRARDRWRQILRESMAKVDA
jgi:putative transcriptional regulator